MNVRNNYRIPILLCICAVAASAQIIPGIGGGDPVTTTLNKVVAWAYTIARSLCVLGILVAAFELLFGTHANTARWLTVLAACAIIFFLSPFVTYFFG